jgi:hypothetical protein
MNRWLTTLFTGCILIGLALLAVAIWGAVRIITTLA